MAYLYQRRVVLDVLPPNEQTIRIDGLFIKFRIDKTSKGTPNKSTIQIYNLSQATIQKMQKVVKLANGTNVGCKIVLYAGYQHGGTTQVNASPLEGLITGGSNLKSLLSSAISPKISNAPSTPPYAPESTVAEIFRGDITKPIHKKSKRAKVTFKHAIELAQSKDGVDMVTQLEVHDSMTAFRNASFSKGYPPGATAKQIAQDLARATGLPIANISGVPDFTYANGITFQGLVREHLFDFCDKNGLDWYFEGEALNIIPSGTPTNEPAIILSQDNGLIGIPMPTAIGVECRSLLQAGLHIGRQITIQGSDYVEGDFVIKHVVHEGDNRGEGDFVSHIEATAL